MEELIKSILADEKIDAAEVKKLRETLYEDGVIDKEEAEAIFKLNDEAKEKDPSFKDLFVEVISDFLLEDDELDEEEIAWLKEKILKDGEVDENEKALLEALAAKVDLPEELAALID